jgi:hypothetical protein
MTRYELDDGGRYHKFVSPNVSNDADYEFT